MTIAWATIDAALKLAVQEASGVTDVFWRWEPSAFRAPIWIRLERSPVTTIGVDARELKRIPLVPTPTPPAHPDRIAARQHGWRSFDLEVRCGSDTGSPRDEGPQDAVDVLAQVSGRIQDRDRLAALRAAGVALSRVGSVARMEYEAEGREARAAVLVITWLCADVDVRADTQAIEAVEGEVTVVAPDGAETPRPFSTP